MELSFFDELECLKSSYNASEFTNFISNKCHILKFTLHEDNFVTFEVPEQYPQTVPLISLTSLKLSNAQKNLIENEIRKYAEGLIGSLMIMDLVIKLQEILEIHASKCILSEPLQFEDNYMAVILIDHIRHKSKYLKAFNSWASELNICGVLMFCQKWIFLIIQGGKENVKEFVVRHKTTCIDVDSSGKPCKERMSKILFEGDSQKWCIFL